MSFKKVILDPTQAEIAKVNLKTGTLYLSPKIWAGLPADEKNFVLFHEQGHLTMQTADEYQANQYAVGKFLNAGTFTNKELGQKIMVMRSVLDKADGKTANFTGIADAAAGATSGIMQTLSVLGIGSKARIAEANANAAANATVYQAQAEAAAIKSKSTIKIVAVIGVLLIVAVAIYFTLRKK